MEDIKQKFLEWVVGNMEYGYLYEDVTDDGDGIFQLTGEGEDVVDFIEQELDKAREEGRREVYEAIVFDENIPHDITTFVAANLWKNMRDKAKEELSKLKDNK